MLSAEITGLPTRAPAPTNPAHYVEPPQSRRLGEPLSASRLTAHPPGSHSDPSASPRAAIGRSISGRSAQREPSDRTGGGKDLEWSDDQSSTSRFLPSQRYPSPRAKVATVPVEDEDEEKATVQVDEQEIAGTWWIRLVKHFVGFRDHRSIPTPLLRPLRHLSPEAEGYLLGFMGTFGSILIACGISVGLSTISARAFTAIPLTVGSLGATAVLLYAVPEGPLSQPRHLLGGHLISALTGAVISQLFALSSRFNADTLVGMGGDNTLATASSWSSLNTVAAALAVALATLLMQITGTIHPPGGATALIASFYRSTSHRWIYVLDVLLSVTAMGIWAMVIGNLGRRRYPAYWWTPRPAPPAVNVALKSSAPSSTTTALRFSPPSSETKTETSDRPQHFAYGPSEDLERRWLGRLGQADEEALAEGDEPARREQERWRLHGRLSSAGEQDRGWKAALP